MLLQICNNFFYIHLTIGKINDKINREKSKMYKLSILFISLFVLCSCANVDRKIASENVKLPSALLIKPVQSFSANVKDVDYYHSAIYLLFQKGKLVSADRIAGFGIEDKINKNDDYCIVIIKNPLNGSKNVDAKIEQPVNFPMAFSEIYFKSIYVDTGTVPPGGAYVGKTKSVHYGISMDDRISQIYGLDCNGYDITLDKIKETLKNTFVVEEVIEKNKKYLESTNSDKKNRTC